MKNHWTKKECDTILSIYKDNTAYFGNNTIDNEPLTFSSMYKMLRLRFGFGEAETIVIIACLIKCGAKIVD